MPSPFFTSVRKSYAQPLLFLLPFHPINFWMSVLIGANRDQVEGKNHDVDRAVEHSLRGSLLKLMIGVDSVAGVHYKRCSLRKHIVNTYQWKCEFFCWCSPRFCQRFLSRQSAPKPKISCGCQCVSPTSSNQHLNTWKDPVIQQSPY